VRPALTVIGPGAHPRLRERPDVIVRKGRFTLVNDILTPQAATAEDLVAIHDALAAASIEHLLVRRDDDRPVIAVDRAQRAEVTDALVRAFQLEPFYSRAGSQGAVLIADGALALSKNPRVLRLFRPRAAASGVLRYGTSTEFQRARALRMKTYVVGDGDDSEARYRQIDELKYALRSVHLFAPWVRRIFIVTDSDRPAWLAEHPDVTIVPSEQFFADPSVLPTHNSHAVESQLHRIEGLSEHFLYSNDDMFFGRAVRPDMFFSPGGVTKFIEASTRIGLGEPDAARSGFENAARVNRALLRKRFGRVTTRHLEHAPTPLRKSVMRELESEFPEDFARTAASAFRSATDISVTNSLYHYYSLMTGHAVVQPEARVKYVETTLKRAAGEMQRILKSREYDFFCLNDGSAPEVSVAKRTRTVLEFLDSYFGIPAPWEVPSGVTPAAGSASSSAAQELPAG
jgi:UDP-glucose 4-epimerase